MLKMELRKPSADHCIDFYHHVHILGLLRLRLRLL